MSNLTEAVVSKDKDLTSETKKQSRAERFGLSTKIGGAPSADLETLKKRAERFGQSSSSVMKKAEMDEKGTIHILRKHFYIAELLQLNRTQFLFLGIFVSKKVGNQKN